MREMGSLGKTQAERERYPARRVRAGPAHAGTSGASWVSNCTCVSQAAPKVWSRGKNSPRLRFTGDAAESRRSILRAEVEAEGLEISSAAPPPGL